MKKYFLYLSVALIVFSCNKDQNQNKVAASFEQFLDTIKVENLQEAENLAPFLVGINVEERTIVLNSFRSLNKMDYKLEVFKKSNELYYLKILPKDTNSIWSDLTIPYELNIDGQWVMAPIMRSIQTFDIIPAKD
ncbi:MAG: hypothetical protein PF693_20240 [Spirochaetia bacterium]|jgi:hypothetical protein|nr:hypothetical protein [Spirochaetia bacterium]